MNDQLEKLVVTGPCNFNLIPVMANLTQLELKVLDCSETDSQVCSYRRSHIADRKLHKYGKCCVSFGTVLMWCPKLEKLSGLDMVSRDLAPSK